MSAQQEPRIHPALTMLVTALAALLQLLGGAPASAASAPARPAPTAPSHASPAPGTSSSASNEDRRTVRAVSRAMSPGVTRRLEPSQRSLHRPGRAVHNNHPGPPATDGARHATPRPLEWTPACGSRDPLRHLFLPVGAGRSPRFERGS